MASSVRSNKKTSQKQLKGRQQQTPLVRIFTSDKTFLETLSSERSQSMPQILHSIISQYRRQEFFDDLAGAYAELRSDSKAWDEEKRERRLYENTLLDGITDR
jgi:hypothetical protein